MPSDADVPSIVGDQAPDFSLPSTRGDEVRLSEACSDGPVVLLFLRGDWCSFCQEQLLTYSFLDFEFCRHFDAAILPVAPDPVPDLVQMQRRFDLSMPLLSDMSLDTASVYTSVEESPGPDSTPVTPASRSPIPVPATFFVDCERIVRYGEISESPSDRVNANLARHILLNDFSHPFPDPVFE